MSDDLRDEKEETFGLTPKGELLRDVLQLELAFEYSDVPTPTLESFTKAVNTLTATVEAGDDRETDLGFWQWCAFTLMDVALMAITRKFPQPEWWAAEAMRLSTSKMKRQLALSY